MHPKHLSAHERQRFDEAMTTVNALDETERLALIEHAVAASIHYAATQKAEVLDDWARGLVATLRLNGNKALRAVLADAKPSSLTGLGHSARDLLAAIRH